MITFAPVQVNDAMLQKYEALFAACFPMSTKFKPNSLRWLYLDNPDGTVVGYDAMDGGTLAAHYVTVPAKVQICGQLHSVVLSLNTATHPAYQGKGLFTKLAELTYAKAAELGYSAAFGVANGNSTPGFVRKLGFKLIEPLGAMVGVRSLNIDFERVTDLAQFRRVWSPETLAWRCGNPTNPIAVKISSDLISFKARAFGRVVTAYSELANFMELPPSIDRRIVAPVRLYLGLCPTGSERRKSYISIPDRLRPSPLNLIFRSLRSPSLTVEKGSIFFSFLDFDAY